MIVETKKRSLLVAKGTFEAMRGAERDLIRNLPALSRHFDVTMATLQSSKELKQCCQENSITLLKPAIPWHPETGTHGLSVHTPCRANVGCSRDPILQQ